MPSACAAMPGRDLSRTFIAVLNPVPSSPSKFSAGTWQSSKISSTVGEPRIPIFFSSFPTLKPGDVFSTAKALMPFGPLAGSVTAKTQTTSATPPCVIQILVPLRTYLSPRFSARVRIEPAASEPLPASVSA